MATINGYTAERMKEIEDASIVDGDVIGDNLVLKRRDGGEITAGNVRGNPGPTGPSGEVEEAPINAQAYARKNGFWTPTIDDAPNDTIAYWRKSGAWVSAKPIEDALTGTVLDLPWTPNISWPASVTSLKACRIGPMVFAFAEFYITSATSVGLVVQLPIPSVPWRNVGTMTSFGLANPGAAVGTFRANGGAATAATLINANGIGDADVNNNDRVGISLIYPV